jgi:carbohydrate-selective porin OprB
VQVVDNLTADGRTQLAELWYQQSLWDDRVRIRVGKINANGDFAATANGVSFLNSSMGISPTVLAIPKYPDPALGAQVWVEPNEHLYLGAGIFDGATQAGITTGDHAPTTLFGAPSDLFYIGEAGLKWNLPGGTLHGRAGVGGWHHTGDFARFDGSVDHGASGFYVVVDQAVWREHPDDKEDGQGIGAFFQFGWADENVSPIAEHIGAGAIWTGAIPTRDADVIGLGVTCVVLSGKPGSGFDRSTETAIEWFYKYHLTPWAIIQPDLQYVINPGGLSTRDDSLVAMLRVVFDL